MNNRYLKALTYAHEPQLNTAMCGYGMNGPITINSQIRV